MTRSQRLRRVVLLMTSFARNLAYFRAAVAFRERFPRNAEWDFWMTLSNNSLDFAIVEWCKLVADGNDKHHWSKIVSEPKPFEEALLADTRVTEDAFVEYQKSVRRYRDKFVAHLDSDVTMDIPLLDLAEHAVRFYHAHLVAHEAEEGILRNLPSSPVGLADYYAGEFRVATAVLDRALPPGAV